MPVVHCPTCAAQFTVPNHLADRALKCPQCHTRIGVVSEAVSAAPPRPRPESRPPDEPPASNRGKLLLLLGIPVGLAALVCCGGVTAIGVGIYRAKEAVEDARKAEQQKKDHAKNLQQISLAFQSYHDNYKRYPAQAITSKDGKPLLSWRVALLPFLEQGALYNEFHRDEPWDSPHNKALLSRMPKVYAAPEGLGQGDGTTTYFQVFTGPNTIFDGTKIMRQVNITDGTSNTFLVVDAGTAVPWTKPQDLPYTPTGPLPKLGGRYPEGFHAAMADGSVRFISTNRPYGSDANIRAMITPGGAETIIPPD
jgi:hypothetical protein